MKVLVVAFLCTLAAVQGRSAFSEVAAVLGENPYLVHINMVASNSNGVLRSCVGSLIGSRWVLTSANCVRNSRYMWLRFGLVDVLRPELVVEGNPPVQVQGDLALINVNRVVEDSDNIRSVALPEADSELPSAGKFCVFGSLNSALSCSSVSLESSGNSILAGIVASQPDVGAPLVSDGVQVGVLVSAGIPSAFASVANHRAWIKEVSGL